MANDQDLIKEIQQYSEVAKENKKVDVAALMLNALERQQNSEKLTSGQRHWAYTISVGLPPLGLLFAAKFYFFDKEKSDAKQTALICLILTLFSVVLFYFTMQVLFSTAGVSPAQLKSVPGQLQQLYQ